MFRTITISFVVLSMVSLCGTVASGQFTSLYTNLNDTKCKTLEIDEEGGGSYRGDCGGVAGYKLHVIEDDLRQTIDIISPDGKTHELQFWNFFGGFSTVGSRAEWRINTKKPIALIVRLDVSEDPEDSSTRTSYLIVSKITEDKICVIDILRPSTTQNIDARHLADRSHALPCKAH
jgi:hypothetical protein